MPNDCIRSCLSHYKSDLDTKAVTIVAACALSAAVVGDFSGALFLQCLALGGVADVTVGLSACIVKCLRRNGDDRLPDV